MWHSIVMAIGISLCILGGEFMIVDRVVFADPSGTNAISPYGDGLYSQPTYYSSSSYGVAMRGDRTFIPPEWAPWGLLSAGVLTVLYAASIPK